MAVYKGWSKTRNYLVGNPNLQERTYEEYLDDAKTLSDSLHYPDAKLSISPGNKFSFDVKHDVSLYLFSLPIQGTVRKMKDKMLPGFIANALDCSQIAIEWSQKLRDKFSVKTIEDKIYFEAAQKMFIAQSKLYRNEFEKNKAKIDSDAAQNYHQASIILGQFVYSQELDRELEDIGRSQKNLSPRLFQMALAIKKKVLEKELWYQSLSTSVQESKGSNEPLLTPKERALLTLLSSQQPLLLEAPQRESDDGSPASGNREEADLWDLGSVRRPNS